MEPSRLLELVKQELNRGQVSTTTLGLIEIISQMLGNVGQPNNNDQQRPREIQELSTQMKPTIDELSLKIIEAAADGSLHFREAGLKLSVLRQLRTLLGQNADQAFEYGSDATARVFKALVKLQSIDNRDARLARYFSGNRSDGDFIDSELWARIYRAVNTADRTERFRQFGSIKDLLDTIKTPFSDSLDDAYQAIDSKVNNNNLGENAGEFSSIKDAFEKQYLIPRPSSSHSGGDSATKMYADRLQFLKLLFQSSEQADQYFSLIEAYLQIKTADISAKPPHERSLSELIQLLVARDGDPKGVDNINKLLAEAKGEIIISYGKLAATDDTYSHTVEYCSKSEACRLFNSKTIIELIKNKDVKVTLKQIRTPFVNGRQDYSLDELPAAEDMIARPELAILAIASKASIIGYGRNEDKVKMFEVEMKKTIAVLRNSPQPMDVNVWLAFFWTATGDGSRPIHDDLLSLLGEKKPQGRFLSKANGAYTYLIKNSDGSESPLVDATEISFKIGDLVLEGNRFYSRSFIAPLASGIKGRGPCLDLQRVLSHIKDQANAKPQ